MPPDVDFVVVAEEARSRCEDSADDRYYVDGGQFLASPDFGADFAAGHTSKDPHKASQMIASLMAQVARYRRANGCPWEWLEPPHFVKTPQGVEGRFKLKDIA